MKQINTFLCCFFMALCGIGFAIGVNNESTSASYKTANAAPVLNWAPGVTCPLDLRLTAENEYKKDSTEEQIVVHDTIHHDRIVYRYRTRRATSTVPRVESKRQCDSIPAIMPDTIPYKNVGVGREENPTDTIGPPKESIILIVDGEEVYKR
jgi:hypothetical protein